MRSLTILIALLACAACGSSTPQAAASGTGDAGATDTQSVDGQGGDSATTADGTGADAGSTCGAPTGERPSRRSEHAGAYDPKTGKFVIFGGSTGVPKNCSFVVAHTFETETWVFDTRCDTWHLSQGAGPQGRVRHMSAYDPGMGAMFIFGGRYRDASSGPYSLLNDLWAFSFADESWSEFKLSKRPPPRVNGIMVYADSLNSLILFGGNTSSSGMAYAPADDVWQYDLSKGVWSELTVAKGPVARLFHSGVWDQKRKRLVIYGGADASGFSNNAKYFSDTWGLDFSTDPPKWAPLDAKSNNLPPGRFWSRMVQDAKADRYYLFGGHDDGVLGNRNDLWAFTPADGQWTEVMVGDSFNKPAIGFCKFPPDFSKINDESPERRNGHVFVGGPGIAFLSAGKTDCGVIDDLRSFDFTTLKWTERTPSTVGEGCIRKGGLSCNDYCF